MGDIARMYGVTQVSLASFIINMLSSQTSREGNQDANQG